MVSVHLIKNKNLAYHWFNIECSLLCVSPRRQAPALQAPFHGFSQGAALGGTSLNLGTFLFGFPLFLKNAIFSFTHFRKLAQHLEYLICSVSTLLILAKIMPFFICTISGFSFRGSTHFLEVDVSPFL